MDRGACLATVHRVVKESDTTEHICTSFRDLWDIQGHGLQPSRLLCPWMGRVPRKATWLGIGIFQPCPLTYWKRGERNLEVVLAQSCSHVWLFATLWTAACQASLSFTISQGMLKLMYIESVMSSNHLILCRPLLYKNSWTARLAELSGGWTSGGIGRKMHLPKAGPSRIPCSRLFFLLAILSNIIYTKLVNVGKEFPCVLWAIIANSWIQEGGVTGTWDLYSQLVRGTGGNLDLQLMSE